MFGGAEFHESFYYTKPIEIPAEQDRVLYGLRRSAEDTAFAVYCYLQDATYFRLFSVRAWREFTLGGMGILTAVFCTNSADARIGRISEKLRMTFDSFKDTWMARMHTKLASFFRRYCGDDATVPGSHLDVLRPECDDITFARHANRKLGYYASTMVCLRTAHSMFENFLLPAKYRSDVSEEYLPLLKTLLQLRCLESMQGPIPSILKMDCMYSAARALVLGHLDSDAVLAAQMIYDSQQQLDPQSSQVEEIVEALSQLYGNKYKALWPFWASEDARTTKPLRFDRMYSQQMVLCYAVDDNYNLQEEMDKVERQQSKYYDVSDFGLLRHVPTLIGQIVAQYRFEYQHAFLDIANDYGHILAAIHFYNAARNSEHLQTQRWEDVEWIIDCQSSHTIFRGEPPTKNFEYAHRFCLVYGLDAVKFAANLELPVMGQVNDDVHLKNVAPARLHSCSRFVWTASSIDQIPGSYKNAPGDPMAMMSQMALERLNIASPYGEPNSIGVLIAAKESYDRDELARHFDIIDFHLICWDLLLAVRNICLEEAPNDYPAIRFGNDQGSAVLVAELLRDLASCRCHHERMWPKAINILSEMIKAQGSICWHAAQERMVLTEMVASDSDGVP
ncbi:hypothetical protein B5807_04522 [Epicoccum nigrum]|uniref:Uncharacterized protein n=1 Tax=Epicoccum nigrum TaxID=105696 RepID=A0A1Y2M3Q6_EPING|nr:hypothetical protein B5807_04522 [Epicoccum nigrum]